MSNAGVWYRYPQGLWHFKKKGQQKSLCGVSCAVEPLNVVIQIPEDMGHVCWKCRHSYASLQEGAK